MIKKFLLKLPIKFGIYFFLLVPTIGYCISDGTNICYVNNTNQRLIIKEERSSWFNSGIGQNVLEPGQKKDFYLEGQCLIITFDNDDAGIDWSVYLENNPTEKHNFNLVVINKLKLNCAKRLFTVNDQFRKIELNPIPEAEQEKSTPTPYFLFTATTNGNVLELHQEGPRSNAFPCN